jgi:hypothetical protein
MVKHRSILKGFPLLIVENIMPDVLCTTMVILFLSDKQITY